MELVYGNMMGIRWKDMPTRASPHQDEVDVQQRKPTPVFASLFVLMLLAAGCAGESNDGAESTRVTIDTIGGVTYVRSSGEPPTWATQELLTLGTIASGDEASAEEFGRIVSVIADADGAIYVADASSSDIRVFDERGALVRRMGRSGAGPAEFSVLQSIGWLGDTLVTLDGGNARIGLLTREGQWLGQRPSSRLTGTGLYLHQTAPDELFALDFKPGAGGGRVYVRHDMTAVRDTMAAPHDPARSPSGIRCDHVSGGAISFWSVDFSPRLLRQPAPNGERLDIYSSEYRLHFIARSGDTARVITRDIPPAAIPDDLWDTELARFQAWKDSLPPVNCQPRTLERPATMDLIRGVFFDDAQRIWVELRAREGSVFDVFEPDGRLAGQVSTPKRVETVPLHVRGDRIYLVTRDSMDVPFVKVLRYVRNEGQEQVLGRNRK